MSTLILYIGSKNLSSWSLRPWLFLRHHAIRFDEVLIPLDRADTRARILEHSPSGKVPLLQHGSTRVWDSLAICEYLAETFALPGAWPSDPAARAYARSVACEMHAGFAALRQALPFDATRDPEPVPLSAAVQADIERIRALWREARTRYGQDGPWLFGRFGIADAMYAPVALRMIAYAVPLDGPEQDYAAAMAAHPAVEKWIEAAAMEVPVPEPAPMPVPGPSSVPDITEDDFTDDEDTVVAVDSDIEAPPPATEPSVDDVAGFEIEPTPELTSAKPKAADQEQERRSKIRSFILPPD
ncbi:glutathione S-transferase family protein [Sinimarinibacterium sp. CAU 1509]|uniref:glutathione S-transferase family protein n=1 Tax=Sinimarinibacterium sp. CAU 1509 TaxID=2562283 RepID=UPI0010AC133F|nr:glutathione S-transferase family protein [Sinimarinibacterium sp. CAU 1509]TJY60026.1 glutathione S-transferase family protein [Sinimarinibacterium sp. CAU 1509]